MNKTKTAKWLWIILAIVVLAAIGFFIWQLQSSKTASISPTTSPSANIAGEIDAVGKDLQSLENNFDQLDKINPSEDNAPQL